MKRSILLSILALSVLAFVAPVSAADASDETRAKLIAELKAIKKLPSIAIKGYTNKNIDFEGPVIRETNGYVLLRTKDRKQIQIYPYNCVNLEFIFPDDTQKTLGTLQDDERHFVIAYWLLRRQLKGLAEYYLLTHILGGTLDKDKLPSVVAFYKKSRKPLSPLFGGKLPRNVKDPSELLPRIMPTTRSVIKANKEQEESFALKMKAIAPLTHRISTEHFVIYSAWAKKDDSKLVQIYNRLYPMICKQYLMNEREHIWAGKLPIYAFWKKENFQTFSKTVCGFDATNAGGFASVRGNFNYIVLGAVMNNGASREHAKSWFAELLSHETSHAFLSRYQGRRHIPSWLNEGIAEIVAASLSPNGGTFRKLVIAHQAIKGGKRFQTSFFTDRVSVLDKGVSYGAAQSITRYLAKKDIKGFLQLVLEIKKGNDVEKSLKSIYKMDYKTLLANWQKAVLKSR